MPPTLRATTYAHQDRPCPCMQGACLNCCNDVKGVVMDLHATKPAVGTYPAPSGGEVEVLSVHLDETDIDKVIVGPTGFPLGWNASARVPSSVCCYRPIGFVEWVARNSEMTETGHYWGCVYVGFNTILANGGGLGKTIEIAFFDSSYNHYDYWFYRDISLQVIRTGPGETGLQYRYPMQSVLCSADTAIEMENDLSVAIDTGYTLNVRGTRCLDTHLPVEYTSVTCTPSGQGTETPTHVTDDVANCNDEFPMTFAKRCGNPCAVEQEITLTISLAGKKALVYDYDPTPDEPFSGDEETDLELLLPDFTFTFTVSAGCGAAFNVDLESDWIPVPNTGRPDAVVKMIINASRNEEGKIVIESIIDSAGTTGLVLLDEFGDENTEVCVGFNESFEIASVECGELALVASGAASMFIEYETIENQSIGFTVV